MLRAYGPSCNGELIDPASEKIPEDATWIDLEEPTDAEEQLVERCLELEIPTPEELKEIEPSSRLYERSGFSQRGAFFDYPDSEWSRFYEKHLQQEAVA